MKLYDVSFSTIKYGEIPFFVVSDSKENAIKKAKVDFDKIYGHCYSENANEVDEIDGYKVVITNNKEILLVKPE
jgi:hypothetical protein